MEPSEAKRSEERFDKKMKLSKIIKQGVWEGFEQLDFYPTRPTNDQKMPYFSCEIPW